MLRLILFLMLSCQPAISQAMNSTDVRNTELYDHELPPYSKLQLIAPAIRQNQRTMSIRHFQSQLKVEQVLEYYRSRWSANRGEPGFLENRVNDWFVISRLRNRRLLVIQLRQNNDGSSSGYISVAMLETNATAAKNSSHGGWSSFPTPDGITEISRTTASEHGKTADTLVYETSRGPVEIADFYRRELPGQGWSNGMDKTIQGVTILYFSRDGVRIEVAINRSATGHIIVLLNRVKRNV